MRIRDQYTVYGAIFGVCFPVMSFFISVYEKSLSISFQSVVELHQSSLLIWVIDTAPLFLGLFARFGGIQYESVVLKQSELTALNKGLDDKVKERTKNVKNLLDQIDQAIFYFDESLTIQKEYSKKCLDFFGEAIEGKNACSILFPNEKNVTENVLSSAKKNEEFKSEFQKFVSIVFSLKDQSKMLLENLPKDVSEISIQNSIYRVRYSFLSEVNKLMVLMKDVSREVQLQEQEEFKNILVKVIQDRNGFSRLFKETREMILDAKYSLELDNKSTLGTISRHFHTIKGGISHFGFNKLSRKIHNFEDFLIEVQSLDVAQKNKIDEFLSSLEIKIHQTVQEIEHELGFSFSQKDQSIFEISEERIDRIYHEALGFVAKKKQQDFQSVFEKIKWVPITDEFSRLEGKARELAERLGKIIDVEITANEVFVPAHRYDNLMENMLHLVRNCIDHGIESPAERKELKKEETGKLKFSATIANDLLNITVEDDGAGINRDKVIVKAIEKQLVQAKDESSFSDQEIYDFIFKEGFSTKDDVSDISGRGVGMNALKASILELRGEIHVSSKQGEYTRFEINLPLNEVE